MVSTAFSFASREAEGAGMEVALVEELMFTMSEKILESVGITGISLESVESVSSDTYMYSLKNLLF
jgi:hypothetical protein